MPKKRRSDGKGNIVPIRTRERHTWKCDVKGCNVNGLAYTKVDAKNALTLHRAFSHNTDK